MKFTTIIFDLDGTLLNNKHTISKLTRQTVKLLLKHNIKIILATGRHYEDVKFIQKHLDIKNITITANGARIHDQRGGVLFRRDIPIELSNYLLHIVKHDTKIVTNAYYEQGWFTNNYHSQMSIFHKYSGFAHKIFPKNLSCLPPIYKIFYLGEHQSLLSLQSIITNDLEKQVHSSFSHHQCLEIMHRSVSKGHALQLLVKSHNICLNNCLAFGDGMNDLEMLSIVGRGCIMGNADKSLKSKLPHLEVIGHNQNDGVANYLQNLIQIHRKTLPFMAEI